MYMLLQHTTLILSLTITLCSCTNVPKLHHQIPTDISNQIVSFLSESDLYKLRLLNPEWQNYFTAYHSEFALYRWNRLMLFVSNLRPTLAWQQQLHDLCTLVKKQNYTALEIKCIEMLLYEILVSKHLDTVFIRRTVVYYLLLNLEMGKIFNAATVGSVLVFNPFQKCKAIKLKGPVFKAINCLTELICVTDLDYNDFKFTSGVFMQHKNLLQTIFELGNKEIQKTGCVYNRFIQSTLFYVSWIIEDIKQFDEYVNCCRSKELDYKQCVGLLNYIIDMKLGNDYLILNGTIKQRIISLIVDHKFRKKQVDWPWLQLLLKNEVLFDFDQVWESVINTPYFSVSSANELVDFMVANNLTTVQYMTEQIKAVAAQASISSMQFRRQHLVLWYVTYGLVINNYMKLNTNNGTILNPLKPF